MRSLRLSLENDSLSPALLLLGVAFHPVVPFHYFLLHLQIHEAVDSPLLSSVMTVLLASVGQLLTLLKLGRCNSIQRMRYLLSIAVLFFPSLYPASQYRSRYLCLVERSAKLSHQTIHIARHTICLPLPESIIKLSL